MDFSEKFKGTIKTISQVKKSKNDNLYHLFDLETEDGQFYKCIIWDKCEMFRSFHRFSIQNNVEVYGKSESLTNVKRIEVTNITMQREPHDAGKNYSGGIPEGKPFFNLQNRFLKIPASINEVSEIVNSYEKDLKIQRIKIYKMYKKTLEKNSAEEFRRTGDEYNLRKPLFEFSIWETLCLRVWYRLMFMGQMPVNDFNERNCCNIINSPFYNKLAKWEAMEQLVQLFFDQHTIIKEKIEDIIEEKMNRLNPFEANILYIICGQIKDGKMPKEMFLNS